MDVVSKAVVLLLLLLVFSRFTVEDLMVNPITLNDKEAGNCFFLYLFFFYISRSDQYFFFKHIYIFFVYVVCLTGIPATYYFVPGSDEGVDNWLVYLPVSLHIIYYFCC